MDGMNFEEYRQPWETGPHWELKREFIEKYRDMFSEERLLCLAQAYSNVILLNCSYPNPVMIQINELAKPLKMRETFQGTSDKGTNDKDEERKTKERGQKRKIESIYKECGRGFKAINFCPSSENASSKNIPEVLPNEKEVLTMSPSVQQDVGPSKSTSVLPNDDFTKDVNPTLGGSFWGQLDCNAPQATKTVQSDVKTVLDSRPRGQNLQNVSTSKSSILQNNDSAEDMDVSKRPCFGQIVRNSPEVTEAVQSKAKNNLDLDLGLGEQKAKTFWQKFKDSLEKKCNPCDCILKASQGAGCKADYKINPVNNKAGYAVKFSCTLSLNGCTIASGVATSKKKAKLVCSMNSFDLLTKFMSQKARTIGERFGVEIPDLSSAKKKPEQLNLPDKDYFHLNRLSSWLKGRTRTVPTLRMSFTALNIDKFVTCKRFLSETRDSANQIQKLNIWKFTYKDILIAFGIDKKLRIARETGVRSAFSKLLNLSHCKIENNELIDTTDSNYLSFHDVCGSKPLISTPDEPLETEEEAPFTLNQELFQSSIADSFALIYRKNNTVRCILPNSASFCQKAFGYNLVHHPEVNQHRADVIIDKQIVATAFAPFKDDAKIAACGNAYEALRKKYYMVEIKDNYEDNFKVTREQVFASAVAKKAIEDSNMGCKMLKNMGWRGGGLGSSGIAEPVGIDTVPNYSRGLGFGDRGKTEIKTFRRKIDSMLKDFSTSNSMSDLIFSKEFSKDERKEIHQIAARYHLHSSSAGKNEDRFLVVRRKFKINELVDYLRCVGGSDVKYKLVDASTDEWNPFSPESESSLKCV